MKCSICGMPGTNRRGHPHHMQRGGAPYPDISVKIKLLLTPTKPNHYWSIDGSHKYDLPAAKKLVQKHIQRAEEIIQRSLYGMEITELKINTKDKVGPTASFIASPTPDYIGGDDVKQDIRDNYGDSAADGWMEGDISFPQYDDTPNSVGELHLDLISIN